jgi:acyl-homoserine-lactone acylase
VVSDLYITVCIKVYFYFMRPIVLFLFIVFLADKINAQPINSKDIDIVRDSFGVPHIFAKTDAQVAYGLACLRKD